MHLVLLHPEIPPNTGSIARLCAATKTPLHLIEPLGFSLEDKYLKRAGLDYWPHVELTVHPDWERYMETVRPPRIVMTSKKAETAHHQFEFRPGDAVVLGCETAGLPDEMLAKSPYAVRIPIWGEVRSLNLATAAGILLYEALRQVGELDGKGVRLD